MFFMTIELRPYQIKAIEDAVFELKTSKKHLVVLPTGSGKTIVLAEIIKILNKKTLVIAHSREILSQIKKSIKTMNVNVDVIVKSIQSFNSNYISKFEENIELVLIDECHRSCAKSYKKIIDYFCKGRGALLCGFTATPFRTDGQSIYEIFGFPDNKISLLDLIEEGFLCDFRGYRVKTNTSLKGISTKSGDFIESRLSAVINVKNRNELIVNEYLKIAGQEKTLVFCSNISHAKELKKEFQSKRISCECVHGKMNKNERDLILHKFKSGEVQVVNNCQILTEGFDEPSITCLIMARPTTSKVLYMQMIGRGSRNFPGKDHCKVIEFTDNDYDVCHLEYLIDSKISKFTVENGQSFLKRSKEALILLQEGKEIIVENIQFIKPKSIYEKTATPWQRHILKELNIKHEEPLTEFMANEYINGAYA